MPKALSPPRIFLFGLKACLVQQGQLLQLQFKRHGNLCQFLYNEFEQRLVNIRRDRSER